MDALDDGLEFFFKQMIAGTDVYLCSNDSCGVRVCPFRGGLLRIKSIQVLKNILSLLIRAS
jgi:hypothetical protein